MLVSLYYALFHSYISYTSTVWYFTTSNNKKNILNTFSTNAPLLYPLKTPENLQFSDVFRGYRSGTLVENGLIFKKCFNQLFSSLKILGLDMDYKTCIFLAMAIFQNN